MAEQACSCCNRTFPCSELRRHAVGGGVRGENELLCADCWGVFASAPWDLAGAASPEAATSPMEAVTPAAVQSGHGAASGSGAEHADASSSALEPSVLESRSQTIGAVKRLSGGGQWQRPVGVSKVPSKESLDQQRPPDADDKLSGVCASGFPGEAATKAEVAEQKPAGPKLKRDRSGRFVSRRPQCAAEADGTAQPLDGLAQAVRADDAPVLSEDAGRGSAQDAAQLHQTLHSAMQQRANAVEQCAQLQSQVASLETCLRSARLQVLCIICKADRRSVLALPCGHLLYCSSCMAHQRSSSGSCGKCACSITGVQNVSL